MQEQLKRLAFDYVRVKDEIKVLTEKKNHLEKEICETMNENRIDKLELPDGSVINYHVKGSLKLIKEKR